MSLLVAPSRSVLSPLSQSLQGVVRPAVKLALL
jgi:hypothetical protein